MNELVSILIPAYNAEKWIKDTINSALSQTWLKKEIIIVNDGSTDGTLAIARQFESRMLKVISQENKGSSAARNEALKYAQGDYIQWLDADDLLARDKISVQMKVIEDCGSNDRILFSSPHGSFYYRVNKAKFEPNLLWQDLTPLQWLLYNCGEGLFINPAGWLVSRRLTEKAGPWDTRLCRDIDGEYFSRVVAASDYVKFVQDARCYYRTWSYDQLSRRTTNEALMSVLLSAKLRFQILRSLEDSERTRRASIKYLRKLYEIYYPDHLELIREIETLALNLGGELMIPSLGWKLGIVERLFGRKIGKNVLDAGRKLRLAATVKWDEIVYRLSRKPGKVNYLKWSRTNTDSSSCEVEMNDKDDGNVLHKSNGSDHGKKGKIWIDLDNSPHVPLFIPIMKELEGKGYSILLTSRDCFQVCSLADYYGLDHKIIGKHYGANKLLKALGTIWRSLQLAPVVLKEKPDLSLSHGSRSLIILSSMLRIPTILLFDYEYAMRLPFIKPAMGIVPEAIDERMLAKDFRMGIRKYRGLKEDVYVPSFRPDPSTRKKLCVGEEDILVTIRPPATEAHYHNPEAEKLFFEVVEFLGGNPDVRMVILPRNEKTQKDLIYKTWPQWCTERKIIIPDKAVDGLNLIWHSDLVVSGGGTMNREAAALNVPVYSIFRGKMGAVDNYLAEQGRLTMITSIDDVRSIIRPVRRRRESLDNRAQRPALSEIMSAIEELFANKN